MLSSVVYAGFTQGKKFKSSIDHPPKWRPCVCACG